MRDGLLFFGRGRGFLDVLAGGRLLFFSAHGACSPRGKTFRLDWLLVSRERVLVLRFSCWFRACCSIRAAARNWLSIFNKRVKTFFSFDQGSSFSEPKDPGSSGASLSG